MVVFGGGTFLGGSGSLRDFSGSQWVVVDRSRWFVGDRGWLKIFFGWFVGRSGSFLMICWWWWLILGCSGDFLVVSWSLWVVLGGFLVIAAKNHTLATFLF